MKVEQTKSKHWIKLARKQLKLNWQFASAEWTNNTTCQLFFETEVGRKTDHPNTIALEFKFEGFTDTYIIGALRNYVGYVLLHIEWAERDAPWKNSRHRKEKEYGVRFVLRQAQQIKTIEIWEPALAYIVVD